MDKYFYLVRQYLHASMRYLARAGWKDISMVDDLTTVMADTPLNARDTKVPNGLRYHILDIYLDELEKVDDEHEADIPAEKLLAPLMVLQKECPTRTIREQAKEVLQDQRVRKWLGLEDAKEEARTGQRAQEAAEQAQDDDDKGNWGGFED